MLKLSTFTLRSSISLLCVPCRPLFAAEQTCDFMEMGLNAAKIYEWCVTIGKCWILFRACAVRPTLTIHRHKQKCEHPSSHLCSNSSSFNPVSYKKQAGLSFSGAKFSIPLHCGFYVWVREYRPNCTCMPSVIVSAPPASQHRSEKRVYGVPSSLHCV